MFLFLFQLVFCLSEASFYESTDLSKCKNYFYSHPDATYDTFYALENFTHKSVEVDLHFSVRAAKQAVILLSESKKVSFADPVYEIVIGGGVENNSMCEIRKKQRSTPKHYVFMDDIVSSKEFRSFWIHLKNGSIAVGKEGEYVPFLEWEDPDPLRVRVFSFRTWYNNPAEWYFNCPNREKVLEKLKLTTEEMNPANGANRQKLRTGIVTCRIMFVLFLIHRIDLWC